MKITVSVYVLSASSVHILWNYPHLRKHKRIFSMVYPTAYGLPLWIHEDAISLRFSIFSCDLLPFRVSCTKLSSLFSPRPFGKNRLGQHVLLPLLGLPPIPSSSSFSGRTAGGQSIILFIQSCVLGPNERKAVSFLHRCAFFTFVSQQLENGNKKGSLSSAL